MSARTSSGVGSLGSTAPAPYRMSSRSESAAASTVVESTTRRAVGLRSVTGIGVEETSHENVIASGESLIVA